MLYLRALSILLIATLFASPSLPAQTVSAADPKVDKLLKQMTLEEKIDLISGASLFGTHALPRLGIPVFRMSDGPVGAHIPPPSTAYAAGIGLAASWDTALAHRIGVQLGRDARSRGANFLLGPGVNIYRAPLNGRNFEYFGEDPFLGAMIAVGYIRGVQSQEVSATIKHFMGNNSEFARFTEDSIIDERTMREIYLPIFEAAVKEANVGSIMDSYNLTNGTYMTANSYLNTEVTKKQWGFQGVMMSDWTATHDGIAAANGGLDLEMPFGQYMNRATLLPAIKEGKVSEATIDDKVRRLLALAIRFHWMDRDQLDLQIPRYNQEGRKAALDGAREGMVLLKNEGNLLPVDKNKIKSIAVIGPEAHPAIVTAGGSGEVPPFSKVSLLEGLSDKLAGSINVTYARGIPTLSQMAKKTVFHTAPSGTKRGLMVETFGTADLSGPVTASRTELFVALGRPGIGDPEDLEGFYDLSAEEFAGFMEASKKPSSARWTGYYTATEDGSYDFFIQDSGGYRLLVDDKVVIDCASLPLAALKQEKISLTKGEHKVVLEQLQGPQFGDPFLRLGILKEGSVVDPMAKELASKADVVVIGVGFAPETETEGADREFQLPPGQDELIREIAAANRNTIVAITSGGSVDASGWIDKIRGLLELWYPGQEGGTAVAEAVLGEINPSGHLPISWERKLEDNPSIHSYYYDQQGSPKITYKEGIFVGYRGYEHNQVKPLFPFGYGLSYTKFKYSGLTVRPVNEAQGKFEVSFDVTNEGSRAGAAVAQLYVHDDHAKVPRPEKELKGFTRVNLQAGQKRRVTVVLDGRAFTYYDAANKQWHSDPGSFEVLVGSSSQDIELRSPITLNTPINISVDK